MLQKKKTSPISPVVDVKRLNAIVERLVKRYPDGCPNHVIAQHLGVSEKEIEVKYQEIISCLQKQMRV